MHIAYWILVAGFLQAPAQDQHPDFTGIWKVNEARTIGRDREESEIIDQQDTTCRIEYNIRQLDFTPFSRFVIDGKDQVKGGTTTNARWDGRNLILASKSVAYGHINTTSESLTLSDDGKVLTKVVDSTRDGVTQRDKIVFDKISNDTKWWKFEVGSDEADVKKAWGAPDEVKDDASEKKYVYFNWHCGLSRVCQRTITIANGKVTAIQ